MGKTNKLPNIMSKEEVIKLFENMHKPKIVMACFIALMCGLRVSEVINLKIENVDLQRRRIKIVDSKNPRRKIQGYGKDRYVPIPEIAVSPIKRWLDIIGSSIWFFPSDKYLDKPISTMYLREWFAVARDRANLREIEFHIKDARGRERNQYKYRFHHLRHFYAQMIYDKTRDLYVTSQLLGHTQVSTTQIYAKVSTEQMKETIDKVFSYPEFTSKRENSFIASKEKNPIEILDERFAKGEITDADYKEKIRLLKQKEMYLKNTKEIQVL